jgi:hypothetical protein
MATALLTLSPTWETAAGSGKFPQISTFNSTLYRIGSPEKSTELNTGSENRKFFPRRCRFLQIANILKNKNTRT